MNRNHNAISPSLDADDVFCSALAISVPSSSLMAGLSWRHESSEGTGE